MKLVERNHIEAKSKEAAKNARMPLKKKPLKVRYSVSFHRPNTLTYSRKPKYARTYLHSRKKLDHFATIKYPLTTESTMKKIQEHNTMAFIVDTKANKKQIKNAITKMYDFHAVKVNTLICPNGHKKAYVRLTANH